MSTSYKALALALFLAAVASPAAAAEKRAFTIDDLYRLKGVADPQFSPDGRRIAFVVTTYDLSAGESNADIYVMNADGSETRRMTTDPKSDTHPRWSPDGEWILFVSTREKGEQAWRIPANGGEAQRLTDFAPGAGGAVWTPDGGRLLFVAEVFPECGADSDCNEKLAKDLDEGVIQAHVADDLLYRHWTFWKDGKRFHTLVYDIEAKTTTDLTPGHVDLPAFSAGGFAGLDVSPDGRKICVAGNADANEWETTNKDLFVVPLSGGDRLNITGGNPAFDADPRYSPDGSAIAYLTQAEPGYEADCLRLAVYDRRSGQSEVLTEAFDNWVVAHRWAPDSRSIYFTAEEEGARPLYRIDLDTRRIRPIVDLRHVDAFDVSSDGRRIVVSRRSVGEPSEIWTVTNEGKGSRRLTTFNRSIEDEVDIRPAEEMWFESPTGRKIHTFVVKPHGFDPQGRYPLIVNVHGGPQMQWTDSFRGDWQVYPGAGYVVAFPNPHGSTGFGQAFTRAISRDWGGKVYEDVMAVADGLARLPWVDEERMGAMGWSYGGYMMMWLEGNTNRFQCLAAMMGVYDLPAMWGATEELWFPQFDLGGAPWESEDYEKWSPHRLAARFETPCLVITGEKDYRVPYTQSLEFFSALRKRGVPSRLIVFENDGHWPSYVRSLPLYYAAHLDWFHRYLGGEPSPYDVEEMVRNRAIGGER